MTYSPGFLDQGGCLIEVDGLRHEEGLHDPLEVPVELGRNVLDGDGGGLYVSSEEGGDRASTDVAVEEVSVHVPGLNDDSGNVVTEKFRFINPGMSRMAERSYSTCRSVKTC